MAKLIFELSSQGHQAVHFPKSSLPKISFDEYENQDCIDLPEIAEIDLVRHYIGLSKLAHGVDTGFYPLGSCTMKYNPKLNEDVASLEGFTKIHPLQPAWSVQGNLSAMRHLQDTLSEICGMDEFTLQPAAGAHGEFTGMLIIAAYHRQNNDLKRRKVIVPDAAHGTNPASAVMAGFDVVTVRSDARGGVDLEQLKSLVDDTTAALMLTNPNTLGIFDPNIKEIADLVHEAGGLLYYDGANLNAIMGLSRPGDMGFDVVHLNLHKTFSTPHGGGGPGSGPVGVKSFLIPYLPVGSLLKDEHSLDVTPSLSIGRMRSFHGNFLTTMRALAYILFNGKGLKEVSKNAILNANYMMHHLSDVFTVAYPQICMHEFVLTLEKEKDMYQVNAKDFSKAMLDFNMHPPTMYFPQIVHEALMIEPNETESKATLDEAIALFKMLRQKMVDDPDYLRNAPYTTPVLRVDDVLAARVPVLKFNKESK
jgi:glycine dehydrogenase subunit 2